MPRTSSGRIRLLSGPSIGLLALALLLAAGISPARAAQEIRVYTYMLVVQDELARILSENTETQVKILGLSGGELWARVQAEKPNIGADVLFGFGPGPAILGKREGLWAPYPDAPAWRDIHTRYKDKDGTWYDVGTSSFVLVGNKDLLNKKGYKLPESWFDLLDPKWKGEVVMPSPVTSGTAFMINATFLQLLGWEKGWEFLEKLDKNVAQYTKSGNTPLESVGRGEYMLGITSDEKVPQRLQQGFPIYWSAPKEGIGYEGNILTIVKGTKQLEAAKRVVNFAGTEKFQRWLAQYGYLSARDAPNPMYPTKPKFIDYSYEWAADNHARVIETWKSKFLRK
ncbi:MAG TPA: extracellular solute-binding protein [Candidatus Methylomirabilis sp.]|nr:extracellular solute-binding protein [Candidatus Methylomirabilis sp.]HSC69745.1 extracellular solute-binding protein [Candidatus Methylomirabilis sp.]